MLKDLIALANSLDKLGLIKEADHLDRIAFGKIKKLASNEAASGYVVEWTGANGNAYGLYNNCQLISVKGTGYQGYDQLTREKLKEIHDDNLKKLPPEKINKIISCIFPDGYYYQEGAKGKTFAKIQGGIMQTLSNSNGALVAKTIPTTDFLNFIISDSTLEKTDESNMKNSLGVKDDPSIINPNFRGKKLKDADGVYQYNVGEDGMSVSFLNLKTNKSGQLTPSSYKKWAEVVSNINSRATIIN